MDRWCRLQNVKKIVSPQARNCFTLYLFWINDICSDSECHEVSFLDVKWPQSIPSLLPFPKWLYTGEGNGNQALYIATSKCYSCCPHPFLKHLCFRSSCCSTTWQKKVAQGDEESETRSWEKLLELFGHCFSCAATGPHCKLHQNKVAPFKCKPRIAE